MSRIETLHVELADPENLGEAVRIARRLAATSDMRRCEVTFASRALVAAIHRAVPLAPSFSLTTWGTIVLPPVLLYGAPRWVEVSARPSNAHPWFVARCEHDARGDLRSCLGFSQTVAVPCTGFAPFVAECEAIARAVGMLLDQSAAPTTALPGTAGSAIPVYADAFPLMAQELIRRYPGATFGLSGEIENADLDALLAWLPADRPVEFWFGLDPDDDRAFAAITREAIDPDDDGMSPCIRWDEPNNYWVAEASVDISAGIGTVELDGIGDATQLSVSVGIDHGDVDGLRAWLSARAGAPVVSRSHG